MSGDYGWSGGEYYIAHIPLNDIKTQFKIVVIKTYSDQLSASILMKTNALNGLIQASTKCKQMRPNYFPQKQMFQLLRRSTVFLGTHRLVPTTLSNSFHSWIVKEK